MSPRALIIRKAVSNRIQLNHHGLGDVKGLIVADSLVTLPHVRSVNFADNGFSAKGVSRIMRSLMSCDVLLELDLSRNAVGMCNIF